MVWDFPIVIFREEDGSFAGFAPDFPSVCSASDSREVCEDNLFEAIMEEILHGEPSKVPSPTPLNMVDVSSYGVTEGDDSSSWSLSVPRHIAVGGFRKLISANLSTAICKSEQSAHYQREYGAVCAGKTFAPWHKKEGHGVPMA